MPGRNYGKNHDKVAAELKNGAPIGAALVAGGYSAESAERGAALLKRSKPLREAIARAGVELDGEVVDVPPPEERAELVRAKLIQNIRNGKDEATQSLKMLGSDREVNMWQPENISGGFFLNVPDDWKHLFGQAPAPKKADSLNEIESRDDQ